VLRIWGQRTLSNELWALAEAYDGDASASRGVCSKVVRRMLRLRAMVAFERWRESVVESKRAKAIVMRTLKRMQLGACAGASLAGLRLLASCELSGSRLRLLRRGLLSRTLGS